MDLTTRHLFVATPSFGGMVTQRYMQSAIALLQCGQAEGLRISLELLGGESLITRGRNALAARFMDDPTATHLMFIDADIGFDPQQVLRMLRFDAEVVAGLYPLKLMDWSAEADARRAGGEPPETASLRYVGVPCEGQERVEKDGFVSGLFAGTGFMMIARPVLRALARAQPWTKYSATHTGASHSRSVNQYAWFECMIEPETGHYLSEDYAFCRRYRETGGCIWLDTRGTLTHIGPHEFTGAPHYRFSAAVAPGASSGALLAAD